MLVICKFSSVIEDQLTVLDSRAISGNVRTCQK